MFRWFSKVVEWWARHCSESTVQGNYHYYGMAFGMEMQSLLCWKNHKRFCRVVDRLAMWEAEYARRGYRPLSLDGWIYNIGGTPQYPDSLNQKLSKGEKPVLHVSQYRQRLNAIESLDDELQRLISNHVPEYFVCQPDPINELTFEVSAKIGVEL